MNYLKFCYWVEPSEVERVETKAREKGLRVTRETHLPCRVMRESVEVGCIVPEAWDGTCKRKTSWYLGSSKAGALLVVSREALDGIDGRETLFISESSFRAERLPSADDLRALAASGAYGKRKPLLWDQVDPVERATHERWVRRFGVEESFDALFLYQSANHANFLAPRFYVMEDGRTVPYSIAGSTHVCSSCLEFFGILGERWPVKYVVPCLGAVQFARLPRDEYLRVETRKRR